MKNKSNYGWVLKLVVVLSIFFIVIQIAGAYTDIYPDFSVSNKTKTGYSIFYETLEELGVPISLSNEKLSELDTESIQIVVSNGVLDIEDEEVMNWVKEGGTLAYLSYLRAPITYGALLREDNGIEYYQYEAGYILTFQKNQITNWTLTNNKNDAYHLYQAIGSMGKPIIFNEQHLYSIDVKHSLWYAIPLRYKWVIYQLLVAVLGYLYFAGKRFGKIRPLYEEIERDENEYLYAAAYTYQKAKCWDIVLNSYYKYFLKKIHSTHDNWIDYWKKENLPSLSKAEKLHELMENPLTKRKVREYLKIAAHIEFLNKIIIKRREQVWKNWKRIS